MNIPRLSVRNAGTRANGAVTRSTVRSQPVRTEARYATTHGTRIAKPVPQLFVYGYGAAVR